MDEALAFDELPQPPEQDVHRVAHLVLMALLPALAEADLVAFGYGVERDQVVTGRWFASVQGGVFARGPSEELVRRLAEWGARGVGQSSWGPAVYGIVDGEEAGHRPRVSTPDWPDRELFTPGHFARPALGCGVARTEIDNRQFEIYRGGHASL